MKRWTQQSLFVVFPFVLTFCTQQSSLGKISEKSSSSDGGLNADKDAASLDAQDGDGNSTVNSDGGGSILSSKAHRLQASDRVTCGVNTQGQLKCWGSNFYGQLGVADASSHDGPQKLTLANVVDLGMGGNTVSAVTKAGELYTWGASFQPQTGEFRVLAPKHIAPNASGFSFLKTDVGVSPADALLAVTDQGDVYGLGSNINGILDSGYTVPEFSGLTRVSGLTDVISVSVGSTFACALHESGEVSCFGEIGLKPRIPPVRVDGFREVKEISLGKKHLCAVTKNARAVCYGDNFYGQLGVGDTAEHDGPIQLSLDNVHAVSCYGDRTCALHGQSFLVSCWGASGNVLGAESVGQESSPKKITGFPSSSISELALGLKHACAMTSQGEVYCWGDNSDGELGSNAQIATATPIQVTGF